MTNSYTSPTGKTRITAYLATVIALSAWFILAMPAGAVAISDVKSNALSMSDGYSKERPHPVSDAEGSAPSTGPLCSAGIPLEGTEGDRLPCEKVGKGKSESAADSFRVAAIPNATVSTKDGTTCVPGAGVTVEEGIAACRKVDTGKFKEPGKGGKGSAAWDRTYNVYSCDSSHGWVNNSFTFAYAPGYTDGWSECGGDPGGLRAKPAWTHVWTPQWVGAEWLILAPPGASVVGFNISYNCHVGQSGTGWGATTMVGTGAWGSPYPGWQGYYCYGDHQGGTTGTYNFVDGYSNWLDGEYPGFKISFHCAYAGSCSNEAAQINDMGTRAKNIVIHMRDAVAPTFETGWMGTLADGQWHGSGQYQMGFYAHDGGGGVSQTQFQIDGQTVVNQTHGCDYTTTAPCYEQQVYYWDTINTAGISDGAHTLRARSIDLVGNTSTMDTTIYIDKNAPSSPVNLAVDPADWTAEDSFSVSWDNPSQGSASPIDGAYYKVGSPPASATDGIYVDLPDGQPTSAIDEINAGQAGDTPVYVWLKDKAGNVSHASRAKGTMKFDDTVPGEAKPLEINGWIGNSEAEDFIQIWEKPVGLSDIKSGIAGYATSLDHNQNGDPGTEITDPPEPRIKKINLTEGTWYFHVRAISGSGVPGPVDTAQLKVDLTDPTASISGVPGAEWINHDIALTFGAWDALSGVDPNEGDQTAGPYFKVDGGAWRKGDNLGLGSEGRHTVAYRSQDVAGNGSRVGSVSFGIDKTPPTVYFQEAEDPYRPALVRAFTSDGISGVEGGAISYRIKGSSDPFRRLPTTFDGFTLVTDFPDDHLPAGDYELLAKATDFAGNAGQSSRRRMGSEMVLSAPIKDVITIEAGFVKERKAKRKKRRRKKSKRRARRSGVPLSQAYGPNPKSTRKPQIPFKAHGHLQAQSVSYGRGATIAGEARDDRSRPLAQETLFVYERMQRDQAGWRLISTVRTGRSGLFSLRIDPGYSRDIQVRYPGNARRKAARSRVLSMQVRAGVSFRAKPRRVRNGHAVIFKGRVKLAPGMSVPAGGKLVTIDFLNRRGGRRSWRPVQVVRTDKRGRFKARYRFRHISYKQRIIFSAKVPRDPEIFPYLAGRSKRRAVIVSPG